MPDQEAQRHSLLEMRRVVPGFALLHLPYMTLSARDLDQACRQLRGPRRSIFSRWLHFESSGLKFDGHQGSQADPRVGPANAPRRRGDQQVPPVYEALGTRLQVDGGRGAEA